MKINHQSGLSAVAIIGILAVGAVLLAAVLMFMVSDDQMAGTVSTESELESESLMEAMADDMADTMTEPVTQAVEAANAMKDDKTDMADTMVDEVTAVASEPTSMAAAGTFETYSTSKLALAENGTVVLFFHANWCPSCRGLEANLNANLSSIPANTHILKLDYDSETELKKKYGVVRQHTLVVVDANGVEIKKLTGLTNTLDQVVDQL
jgi:thiol-disulfide isomerase/thioredoxin